MSHVIHWLLSVVAVIVVCFGLVLAGRSLRTRASKDPWHYSPVFNFCIGLSAVVLGAAYFFPDPPPLGTLFLALALVLSRLFGDGQGNH